MPSSEKLTWNQRRAATNMLAAGAETPVTPREIADLGWGQYPYLCGASARSAIMALVRKGLAEVVSAGSPMTYRLTPAGREALAAAEGREDG